MKIAKRSFNRSGQALIELVLSLFAFMTIVFMYFQVAMGFSVANFIHYATYMAARAYLSGGANEAAQRQAAQQVFALMMKNDSNDRFKGIVAGSGDGDPAGLFIGRGKDVAFGKPNSRDTAWQQGVTYAFSMKMYTVPLIPGIPRGQSNVLTLTSESWLGREPTTEECVQNLRSRKSTAPNGENLPDFLFDNGC